MIRHRPFGSGHPYAPDTEQRWPVVPVVGEPWRLGVRTSGQVEAVTVEIRCDDLPQAELELVQVVRSSRGQAIDGGHLASAQARQARRAGGWQVELDQVPSGLISYRFIAWLPDGGQRGTAWFTVAAAAWRPAPDATLGSGSDQPGEEIATLGSGSDRPGEEAAALRSGRPGLVPGSVEVLDDGVRLHRVRFDLGLAPGEHVVGFGERYDALDQRGQTLDAQVFEQYKGQGRSRKTYLPMPFAHVVGGVGWGFHVHTSRRVWFDVGASQPDRLTITAEVDQPSDSDRPLDWSLYVGSPTAVLDQFLDQVGRARQLPDWVFRLWASSNEWNTQAEVERQVDLHRKHGLPLGNLVIEAWSDEKTFTCFRDAQYEVNPDGAPHRLADFSFPPDGAWPDPKGLVDRLHQQEIKVHLWQIPLLKARPHPVGQAKADLAAAVQAGVLIRQRGPDGRLRPYRNRGWWFPLSAMPDLTAPEAARWWTERRRYLVEEVGVDGFKTDGGEHAWGADLVYLDGRSGAVKNNAYPVAYARAYGDLLESCGKAPVTFSRAGHVGSQAHGAFWAGDEDSTWPAFRWSMLAGLSAAACGIVYWGWDIAGFSGPVPQAELYVRAMAASAFLPIMQYHSEFNHHRRPCRDRTPWNVADQTGDPAVLDEVRQIVRLRERLLPYLAAQARLTVETSRPLMRPLFFDHPGDPAVWEHPIQWQLGDHILVAPVTAPGVESWPVYLPAGHWVEAWSGRPVSGAALVQAVTARHQTPAWVAAAAWPDLRTVFDG
ncbi:MAG: glycoside hydrolase family 31 [Propionibacteriaceae bacterium]|jgi:alpha-glucosidase (family GH31 glycosyl hydrolase)|nr:glycoside hydrolase family 31 [Propionibacteriaceae bacterium]